MRHTFASALSITNKPIQLVVLQVEKKRGRKEKMMKVKESEGTTQTRSTVVMRTAGTSFASREQCTNSKAAAVAFEVYFYRFVLAFTKRQTSVITECLCYYCSWYRFVSAKAASMAAGSHNEQLQAALPAATAAVPRRQQQQQHAAASVGFSPSVFISKDYSHTLRNRKQGSIKIAGYS
uniref:Secreted protein n=1 Tax=Syphacia muris TaxID=451379 RepID=A0A0N5B0J9_9BILA